MQKKPIRQVFLQLDQRLDARPIVDYFRRRPHFSTAQSRRVSNGIVIESMSVVHSIELSRLLAQIYKLTLLRGCTFFSNLSQAYYALRSLQLRNGDMILFTYRHADVTRTCSVQTCTTRSLYGEFGRHHLKNVRRQRSKVKSAIVPRTSIRLERVTYKLLDGRNDGQYRNSKRAAHLEEDKLALYACKYVRAVPLTLAVSDNHAGHLLRRCCEVPKTVVTSREDI